MKQSLISEVAEYVNVNHDIVDAVVTEFTLQLHRHALEYCGENGDFIGEYLWSHLNKRTYYHILGFLDFFSERYGWEPGSATEYLLRLGSPEEWRPFHNDMKDWRFAEPKSTASHIYPWSHQLSERDYDGYKDKIISKYAIEQCKKVSNKVILEYQKMTEGMQSGDDTPLKSIWDEICVQVQGEESFFYDVYLDMIRSSIQFHITDLDNEIKQAIWLQTDQGMEWECGDDNHDKLLYCDEDIVDYILNHFVLSSAADWTNKRIEKFLEREID